MPPNIITPKKLQELAETPFGPYVDQDVLAPECKSTPTNVLTLEDVMFQYGGRAVGLDQIEGREDRDSLPKYVQRMDASLEIQTNATIYFRGILTVQSLKQLTDAGKAAINTEIARRFHECHFAGNPSPYNIKAFFKPETGAPKEDLPIKILIQGEKNMPAIFMAGKGDALVKDGLKLTTKNRHRIYEVLSLDTETYELSRTFLFRYHTLHTLELISNRTQSLITPENSAAVLKKRTPEWFADRYIRYNLYAPPTSIWRRSYYVDKWVNDDRSDFGADEDDGGENRSITTRTVDPKRFVVPVQARDPEDAARIAGRQTTNPRYVRKPHKAEILSVFASHCEWIIFEQRRRLSQKRILNVDVWQKWLEDVVVENRRMARERSVKWGVRDEYDGGDNVNDEDEGEFERDIEMYVIEVENSEVEPEDFEMVENEEPPVLLGRRTRERTPSIESDDTPLASPPPSRNATAGPSRIKRARNKTYEISRDMTKLLPLSADDAVLTEADRRAAIYDSDFDSPSPSPSRAPNSPASSRSPSPHPIDPEIISIVNSRLKNTLLTPRIRADSTWRCEIEGCGYSVNMMDLTDQDVCGLSGELKNVVRELRQQRYRWPGRQVYQNVFVRIVRHHYEEHWTQENLRIVTLPNEQVIWEWINPKWHRPWPPPVKLMNNPRAYRAMMEKLKREGALRTKEEDEESIEV